MGHGMLPVGVWGWMDDTPRAQKSREKKWEKEGCVQGRMVFSLRVVGFKVSHCWHSRVVFFDQDMTFSSQSYNRPQQQWCRARQAKSNTYDTHTHTHVRQTRPRPRMTNSATNRRAWGRPSTGRRPAGHMTTTDRRTDRQTDA